MPAGELAMRMLLARTEAPDEDVVHLPVVGEPAGGGVCVRDQVPIAPRCRVELVGESRVGVVALALGGIASEPPGGNGERSREQHERDDEPDPAGPTAFPPRWRGGAREGCLRLHTERRPNGRNVGRSDLSKR